jgi:hypothetical protein
LIDTEKADYSKDDHKSQDSQSKAFHFVNLLTLIERSPPNGLRYPRWGGDGEAVQPEKG